MNRKGKLEDKLQYTQFVPKSKILLTPMLVGVFIVPVSLLLWIFGILSSQFLPDQGSYLIHCYRISTKLVSFYRFCRYISTSMAGSPFSSCCCFLSGSAKTELRSQWSYFRIFCWIHTDSDQLCFPEWTAGLFLNIILGNQIQK